MQPVLQTFLTADLCLRTAQHMNSLPRKRFDRLAGTGRDALPASDAKRLVDSVPFSIRIAFMGQTRVQEPYPATVGASLSPPAVARGRAIGYRCRRAPERLVLSPQSTSDAPALRAVRRGRRRSPGAAVPGRTELHACQSRSSAHNRRNPITSRRSSGTGQHFGYCRCAGLAARSDVFLSCAALTRPIPPTQE